MLLLIATIACTASSSPVAPPTQDTQTEHDSAKDSPTETGLQAGDDDDDGYTVEEGDCDDADPAVHPGAPEACDGLDNDCDGVLDDLEWWYVDADGDGYGDTVDPYVEERFLDGPGGVLIGDVDGDGFDDLGVATEGEAFQVRHGGATGFDETRDHTVTAPDSVTPDAGFGALVSAAGDVNADGFDDVLVGAMFESSVLTNNGAAFLYLGSAEGLVAEPQTVLAFDPALGDGFGSSLAPAGDVNADGYGDVMVGAGCDDNNHDSGCVYLISGGVGGLGDQQKLLPPAASTNFGRFYVAPAGDVDGDGYDDVLIGDPYNDIRDTNAGAAYIFFGSAGSVTRYTRLLPSDGSEYDYFGRLLAPGGDIDGDGYGDVLIASGSGYSGPAYDNGAVYVYFGSADGTLTEQKVRPDAVEPGRGFGSTFASLGDLNGDGRSETAVSSATEDMGTNGSGVLYLLTGSSTGVDVARTLRHSSTDPVEGFGRTLAWTDSVGGGGLLVGKAGDSHSLLTISGGVCSDTPGMVLDNTDCDDGDATVHPGADEACDGIDNNCDGSLDDTAWWYADGDGDGFGNPEAALETCASPVGHVQDDTDCDDSDATTYPWAEETCDEADNDCDGSVDDVAWYPDVDGDGYGDPWGAVDTCEQPAATTGNPFDCDDDDPSALGLSLGSLSLWSVSHDGSVRAPVATAEGLTVAVEWGTMEGDTHCTELSTSFETTGSGQLELDYAYDWCGLGSLVVVLDGAVAARQDGDLSGTGSVSETLSAGTHDLELHVCGTAQYCTYGWNNFDFTAEFTGLCATGSTPL